jgi:large subunit ribosomal protein L30e
MASPQVPLEREIKNLIKTGRYYIGSRRSLRALKRGEAKVLIVAENTPPNLKEKALYYAKLAGVQVIAYKGSSVNLGLSVGKPFPIAMIAVLDVGSSRLLEVASLQGSGYE